MSGPADRVPRADRRKSERRPHRLSVKLHAARTGETVSYMGLTENLCEGGVFVATRAPDEIGNLVDLIIGLPEQKIVRVRGCVRWRRFESSDGRTPPGIGIQFRTTIRRGRRSNAGVRKKPSSH